MQEVWLAALERPPKSRGSLRGWLATVLRRKAIDGSRAAGRRAHYEAGQPAPRRSGPADDLIAETEMQGRVTDAVLALDEPYRAALVLRYVGGHPVAEVARLLDVPVETVRTRLKRGLARLRKQLDGEQGGRRDAWMAVLAPIAWPDKALGISTGTAATVIGGGVMGSKVAVVAGGVLVAALATWAFLGPTRSETDSYEAEDETVLGHVESGRTVDDVAPILKGRRDEGATRSGSGEGMPTSSSTAQHDVYGGPKRAPGRIAGRILGPEAQLVQGVTLVFDRLEVEGKPLGGGGFPKHWGADSHGWFRIDDLPEGAYALRISAPGFVEQRLEVPAGHEPLSIALQATVTLSGRVFAEDPRLPVAGIPLIARPEESPVLGHATQAETDAEGRFVFEGLPPGGYLITFGFRNRAVENPTTEFVPVRVGPVETGRDDVEVRLVRGEIIAGTLVDESGSPITSAVRVEALGLTDEGQKIYGQYYFAASTFEGRFRLSGLVRGTYALSFDPIRRKGARVLRGPRTTYVCAVVSGTVDLEVTLLDGMAVHGRLVDGEGKEVSGRGFVQVRPAGSPPGGQEAVILRVDDEGRFHTPPLDPFTTYTVQVGSFPGRMPQTIEGVVPSEEALVVTLADAGRITGRVVDESGAPATGTSVRAHAVREPLDSEGRSGFAHVDSSGRFALEGLGKFDFYVQAGGSTSGFIPVGEPLTVKSGQTDVVLLVKPGVPFSGRLVDEHGRPVRSPYISATSGSVQWFTQVSDDEGRFRLPGVPPGKIRISARIDGEFVSLGEFEAPGKDVEIRVPAR